MKGNFFLKYMIVSLFWWSIACGADIEDATLSDGFELISDLRIITRCVDDV